VTFNTSIIFIIFKIFIDYLKLNDCLFYSSILLCEILRNESVHEERENTPLHLHFPAVWTKCDTFSSKNILLKKEKIHRSEENTVYDNIFKIKLIFLLEDP